MTHEQWGEIRQRLLKTVGQNNFTTWIEPLVAGKVAEGIATLYVPTNFFGNYVSQNFSDLILHEINTKGVEVSRLNFALQPRVANAVSKPASPPRKEHPGANLADPAS